MGIIINWQTVLTICFLFLALFLSLSLFPCYYCPTLLGSSLTKHLQDKLGFIGCWRMCVGFCLLICLFPQWK